jgi:hypothetical protein
MKMKVNNKEYLIDKSELVIQVGENEGLVPYGYSIEQKYKNLNWHTYWTNTIYSSLQSALNAIIQIPKGSEEEYRVVPLYRLQGSALREYKINEVLGDQKTKGQRLKEIKAWKLKNDFEYPIGLKKPNIIKRGSVFIQLENGTIIKSGQSEKTIRYWRSDIKKHLENSDLFEEIELKDEKWLYPHLLKELKNKIK